MNSTILKFKYQKNRNLYLKKIMSSCLKKHYYKGNKNEY